MSKYNDMTIEAIRAESVFSLANRVNCNVSNDEASSFLLSVQDAVLEQLPYIDADDWHREMVENYSGLVDQIAGNAPDPYTHTMWQEFVGTAAWQEDIDSEIDSTNIDTAARIRLEQIAYRLARLVADEIADSITDADAA